jgi:hypothetical protein
MGAKHSIHRKQQNIQKDKQMSYTSVNGYKVKKLGDGIKIDPKIKELLTDPISMDWFKNPVYLFESRQIYDYTSIRDWLINSNKDPLTGILINIDKVKVIHCVNYFIILLCLEEKDDIIYYHPPYGNILDTLLIGNKICNGYEITNTSETGNEYFVKGNDDKIYLIKKMINYCDKSLISLDLRDYIMDTKLIKICDEEHKTYICKSLDNVRNTTNINIKCDMKIIFKEIDMETLITICPISGRLFDKTCQLSNEGIFIHQTILYDNMGSSSNTLSDYGFIFEANKSNKIKVSEWNEYFKHDIKDDDSFEVIIKFIDNRDERKMESYDNIKNLKKINTTCISYMSAQNNIYNTLRKSRSNSNDMYLECNNTYNILHKFYIENKDKANKNAIIKVSKIVNDMIEEMRKANLNHVYDNRAIYEKRQFFGLPSVFNSMPCYECDLSFLRLSNHTFKKKDFKMCYFIGTHFDNVYFDNCRMGGCVFIGSNLKKKHLINCTSYSKNLFDKNFGQNDDDSDSDSDNNYQNHYDDSEVD